MILDFHVHGKISNKYSFDKERFLLTVEEAKQAGMDGFAITEHCHAENFYEEYEFLKANYEYIDEYFNVDEFKVFYGMEVSTRQGLDILFIGKTNMIIDLREKVVNNLNGHKYIDINDLFRLDITNQILVILAHPYREHSEFPNLNSDIINRIDAIEINARDMYKNGIQTMKEKVLKLAKRLELPIVCGSDTHFFLQMSSVKNVFNNDCRNVEEIKKEIEEMNYSIEISPELNIRVRSAIIIKKLICNK